MLLSLYSDASLEYTYEQYEIPHHRYKMQNCESYMLYWIIISMFNMVVLFCSTELSCIHFIYC